MGKRKLVKRCLDCQSEFMQLKKRGRGGGICRWCRRCYRERRWLKHKTSARRWYLSNRAKLQMKARSRSAWLRKQPGYNAARSKRRREAWGKLSSAQRHAIAQKAYWRDPEANKAAVKAYRNKTGYKSPGRNKKMSARQRALKTFAARMHYRNNPERHRRVAREWFRKNIDKIWLVRIRKKFGVGMTPQLLEMLKLRRAFSLYFLGGKHREKAKEIALTG